MEKKHIVLVHGSCLGAWSWYKVKPLLEAAGHRVTALDMAASGIDMRTIEEVKTFAEYSQPLLDFLACLPPNERVVLVGHSFGGMNIALAMEKFSHKIDVAVFLAAFMPDTIHRPSYVLEQFLERIPREAWLDTQFYPSTSLPQRILILFGPKFLSSKVLQLSPIKDLELTKLLIRPSSLFIDDLSMARNFTCQGYGSVRRVYIICEEDKTIPVEFQKWMIQNNPVEQVFIIQDSDHVPLFSKPIELSYYLSNIATNCA